MIGSIMLKAGEWDNEGWRELSAEGMVPIPAILQQIDHSHIEKVGVHACLPTQAKCCCTCPAAERGSKHRLMHTGAWMHVIKLGSVHQVTVSNQHGKT